MLKRIFDVIFSVLGLIFLLPIFAIIAFLIKWDSAGSIFYRGERVGQFNKKFKIFKFRSMVINADKIGGSSTSGDDPRITGIGKFLRKYKIDEFPQLINILKGEMSFVGPRPEVVEYVELFSKKEKIIILSLKPGITDYASIWNHDEGKILAGSKDPEKTYLEKIRPKKVELQMRYIKEMSFLNDLKIIFKTIKKIIKKII